MKWINLYILLLLLPTANLLAETCKNISENMSGNTGSMRVSGNLCLSNNNYTDGLRGSLLVNYDNFSANGIIHINGRLSVEYNADKISPSPDSLSLTYQGGPVNYTIGEITYEVVFNQLVFDFDGSMKQIGQSGNITVNGNILEAVNVPYDYVKIF